MMLKPAVRPFDWVLLASVLAVFVWSGIGPFDRFTWYLECAPAVVGLFVIIALWKRFRLTDLTLALIALHMIILCVGGKYTYARVPLGDWVRDVFHLTRNHYDRLGHFVQGFVPAMIARELLIRLNVISRRGWLPFLVVSICLAISACYELVEWLVAISTGEAAESFLGTQGDIWDTQTDMATALIGAIAAVTLLSRWQDSQLAEISGSQRTGEL